MRIRTGIESKWWSTLWDRLKSPSGPRPGRPLEAPPEPKPPDQPPRPGPRPGGGRRPVSEEPKPGSIDDIWKKLEDLQALEQALEAERAAQAKRLAALSECESVARAPVGPAATTENLQEDLDALKKEFEELQDALRKEVGTQLDAIDAFTDKYNDQWNKTMDALDDYYKELGTLKEPLKELWQARKDRDQALKIAEVLDDAAAVLTAVGGAALAAGRGLARAGAAGIRGELRGTGRALAKGAREAAEEGLEAGAKGLRRGAREVAEEGAEAGARGARRARGAAAGEEAGVIRAGEGPQVVRHSDDPGAYLRRRWGADGDPAARAYEIASSELGGDVKGIAGSYARGNPPPRIQKWPVNSAEDAYKITKMPSELSPEVVRNLPPEARKIYELKQQIGTYPSDLDVICTTSDPAILRRVQERIFQETGVFVEFTLPH